MSTDPREFLISGARYPLAAMLSVNADDPDFCAWAQRAKPGERFVTVGEPCECVEPVAPLIDAAAVIAQCEREARDYSKRIGGDRIVEANALIGMLRVAFTSAALQAEMLNSELQAIKATAEAADV